MNKKYRVTNKGVSFPKSNAIEKNYNPLKAFFESWQSLSKSGGELSNQYNKLLQSKQEQQKEDKIQKQVNNDISKGLYRPQDFEKHSAQIRKKILEEHPSFEACKMNFGKKIIPFIQAYGGGVGKSALSFGAQKIGEKVSGLPIVGKKIASFFEKIGYDESKTKKKAIDLIGVDGSINTEAFSDPNREGFSDLAMDVFISKPLSLIMKMSGSMAGGAIAITILGPIGIIPMVVMQFMSAKSTFESIAVEIPQRLFQLITSTVLNGFKKSAKFDNLDGFDIEIGDKDIFVKDKDGIIIGNSKMNPEEIEDAKIFKSSIEIATDKNKTIEEKNDLINNLADKFANVSKKLNNVTNESDQFLNQLKNQLSGINPLSSEEEKKSSFAEKFPPKSSAVDYLAPGSFDDHRAK